MCMRSGWEEPGRDCFVSRCTSARRRFLPLVRSCTLTQQEHCSLCLPCGHLLFGLSLAGALLSKFTSGVLFLAFITFALSLRWRPVPGQPEDKTDELREWRRERRRATLRGILWAAAVVYLVYFGFSLHQPTNGLYRIGNGVPALILRRLLMPPFLYLRGVFFVLITGRRTTFVLGHSYPHGVWFYFPIVFVLKSCLGFVILLLRELRTCFRRPGTRADTASATRNCDQLAYSSDSIQRSRS
jgi:hypothetical protein